jgi:two-component system, response regulator PdtaR
MVLVVEDEKITANDIKDSLENLGYRVPALVSSGAEAINRAEELKPDLVIMDIMLEGFMDGIEAAEEIRSRLDIPVIYLTAYSDKKTVERAKVTQPYDYIHKPFRESELQTAIEISLYRHRMEKKLKDQEKWLTEILNSISDGVIATDYKGRIMFMNPVAEKLTGWVQEEALGEYFTYVFNISSDDINSISEISLNEDLSERISSYASLKKVILLSKDQIKKVIDGRINPIKNDKGKITGLVIVFRNVFV